MKRFLSARAAIAAAACVSALAAAACASTAPRNELAGTSWIAEGQPGATLAFGRDRISGSGGCNRFFGGYDMQDTRIALVGVDGAHRVCAGEIMRQEADFLAAIAAAQTYRRDGDRLTLSGGEGPPLVLRART